MADSPNMVCTVYGQPCHRGYTAQNTKLLQILLIASLRKMGETGQTQAAEETVITE